MRLTRYSNLFLLAALLLCGCSAQDSPSAASGEPDSPKQPEVDKPQATAVAKEELGPLVDVSVQNLEQIDKHLQKHRGKIAVVDLWALW